MGGSGWWREGFLFRMNRNGPNYSDQTAEVTWNDGLVKEVPLKMPLIKCWEESWQESSVPLVAYVAKQRYIYIYIATTIKGTVGPAHLNPWWELESLMGTYFHMV